MRCPPFETQNVSMLVGPHFCMHHGLITQPPKPVTHVTRQHQTSSPATKNYGFPKTDAPVARVTIPFRFPPSSPPRKREEGVSCPLRGPRGSRFYYRLCEPLPPLPPLPSPPPPEPRPSQPGPAHVRALPRPATAPGGCRTTGAVSTNLLTPPKTRL